MECLSLRRLHRDAVPPASANVEVDVGNGEACGAPPLGERVRLDARCEHTLSGRSHKRLETEGQTAGIGHRT